MKILLLTPPFTQLNTPYPGTAYLMTALKAKGVDAVQCDLSISFFLKLFSKATLTTLFDRAEEVIECGEVQLSRKKYKELTSIMGQRSIFCRKIESIVAFLQGRQSSLAYLLSDKEYYPQTARFMRLSEEDVEWGFGAMGVHDRAMYYSTLFIEDIGEMITSLVDENFGFNRYAERLGRCAGSFNEIAGYMTQEKTLLEELLIEQFAALIEREKPDLVGFSVPFPGNLISGLRCAQWLKERGCETKIVMGGGFVNTELRSIYDCRFFEYVDYLLYDDGEAPLLQLVDHLKGKKVELSRCAFVRDGEVVYVKGDFPDLSMSEVGFPSYEGINFNDYISTLDVLNPMHRLWSDGKWNKLTLAHGCYWGKCSFCDGTLDYIKRFEHPKANLIVDRMEQIISQTGEIGFHFVDEAAPPALLRMIAEEIIRRELNVVWWGNIRFEKSFSLELCQLLKQSGCIAVSGGLEVASDRLLKLINKGVSVEQVTCVADAFTQAGIMVHAYLMYGFPSQTEQECIDALEVVRQLFEAGVVQSGFWHRFALTAHSPIGQNPESFGLHVIQGAFEGFANNDVEFEDEVGVDYEKFAEGLRVSLYNYMQGVGFDQPLQRWFSTSVPRTKIKKGYIRSILK